MQRKSVGCTMLALSLAAIAAIAFAQPAGSPLAQPRAISGGIGLDEAQAMRSEAHKHSVALTLTSQRGEYLADVDVTVRDRAGRPVLNTVAKGPIVLIDLPPGRYTVEASFDGRTQRRDVTVAEGAHRALALRWTTPADPDTAPASATGGRATDATAAERTDTLRAMSAGEAGAVRDGVRPAEPVRSR